MTCTSLALLLRLIAPAQRQRYQYFTRAVSVSRPGAEPVTARD